MDLVVVVIVVTVVVMMMMATVTCSTSSTTTTTTAATTATSTVQRSPPFALAAFRIRCVGRISTGIRFPRAHDAFFGRHGRRVKYAGVGIVGVGVGVRNVGSIRRSR